MLSYQKLRTQSQTTHRFKAYLEMFLSMLISRPYADGPASIVNFERVMQGSRLQNRGNYGNGS